MSPVNLIPTQAGKTPNYWCTWGVQGWAFDLDKTSAAFGLDGHHRNAEMLTEANLFGPDGWAASDYLGAIKADLYMVYDVGWDVPLLNNMGQHDWKWLLGSMELAEDKFPSCTGAPAERLSKLNDLTRRAGWRGAGLWLHAQVAERDGGAQASMQAMEAYFRERARWCRAAGIEYWKVDYGAFCGNLDFRTMLTRVALEEYPGLLVEHARNGGPFNDQYCPWDQAALNDTGSFRAWGNGEVLQVSVDTMAFSDLFRAYDLSYMLTTPTMLDRVAQLLLDCSDRPEMTCLINCEDEPYLGAVLGCTIGIMHHPAEKPLRGAGHIRAVRWQRIAPAFGAGLTENRVDARALTDTWLYHSGDDWVDWMNNKQVKQVAPARTSRNLPLPEVACDGEPPFVVAAQHPNGATSVATLPRTMSEHGHFFPLADVQVEVCDPAMMVGIFGRYQRLTLRLPQPLPATARIWAQDLAADEAVEITDQVQIVGRDLVLEGRLIQSIGLSAARPGDVAEPGLVLAIQ